MNSVGSSSNNKIHRNAQRPILCALLIIFGIFLLLLLCLCALFSFDILKNPCSDGTTEKTNASSFGPWGCTTLQCSLNPELNPCEDFYEFVCAGFMNHTGWLPAGFDRKSQFNILWHQSWTELIALLNNRSLRQQNDANGFSKQMFLFYDKCRKDRHADADGSRGLFAHLESVKYPQVSTTNKRFDTRWLLMAHPFVPFFNMESTWDVRPGQSGKQAKSMFLFEPKKTLTNYPQLMSEGKSDTFYGQMVKILRYLFEDDQKLNGRNGIFVREGQQRNIEREIDRRVRNLIKMERKIAVALDDYHDGPSLVRFSNLSIPEHYVPIQELSELYTPSIDWLQLLRVHGPPSNSDFEGKGGGNGLGMGAIDEQMEVLVLGHELLLAYRRIIDNAEQNEPEMLSDYLDWALIWRFLSELDQRFVDILRPEAKSVADSVEKICTREFVRIYFKHWLDRLYVQNAVDKNILQQNTVLLRYVKQAFGKMLDEATWMDATSWQMARKKLARMQTNIGYFKLIEDEQALNGLYAKYALTEKMAWPEMFGHVHRQFYLWPTLDYQGSYWVDGFYKWVYNSVAMYAGIIHPPWFDPLRPSVMNFGAMGTFMGHEVTHGFDSSGWHFDENGNRRENGQMNQETLERMAKKMECFVHQYANYESEQQRPNPFFTLPENIADNGAIRASHRAWHQFKAEHLSKASRESNKLEEQLRQFNEEQLFFIASAFTHCTAMAHRDATWYAWNDNHAFPRARVNLPLQNFDAFSRAFKCANDTKMNPVRRRGGPEPKCRLW